jgi:hypothetical protein
MSIERPLPKLHRSTCLAIATGFIALSSACVVWVVRTDSLTPLWLVAAGLIGVFVAFYYRRCCPQCGRRMKFRAEPLRQQAWRYRILFDCKHCDIVWDSGEIGDDDSGGS